MRLSWWLGGLVQLARVRFLFCYNAFAVNLVAFFSWIRLQITLQLCLFRKEKLKQELINVRVHRTKINDEGEWRLTRTNRQKDIGSIACSAKPLVAWILHAIHELRQDTDEYPVFISALGVSALTKAQKLSEIALSSSAPFSSVRHHNYGTVAGDKDSLVGLTTSAYLE